MFLLGRGAAIEKYTAVSAVLAAFRLFAMRGCGRGTLRVDDAALALFLAAFRLRTYLGRAVFASCCRDDQRADE